MIKGLGDLFGRPRRQAPKHRKPPPPPAPFVFRFPGEKRAWEKAKVQTREMLMRADEAAGPGQTED